MQPGQGAAASTATGVGAPWTLNAADGATKMSSKLSLLLEVIASDSKILGKSESWQHFGCNLIALLLSMKAHTKAEFEKGVQRLDGQKYGKSLFS